MRSKKGFSIFMVLIFSTILIAIPVSQTDIPYDCEDDLIGCMEKIIGKWRPVLVLEDYNSLGEFRVDCCPDCTPCFDNSSELSPLFVEVTF